LAISPNSAASIAVVTEESSVTSANHERWGLPSGERSSTATCAPASATESAIAAPMPLAPPVTTAVRSWKAMVPPSSLCGNELVALAAQAGDLHLRDVSGAQVRVPPGQGHPLRGAGDEQIARFKGHVLAHAVDDRCDVTDHVVGVGILPRIAVDPRTESEVVDGHHVGGHQVGAGRGETGGTFPLRPLAAGLL